jgi:L-alanine-DL-glutamate epimerase-like enolase superfamily enzyme
MKIKSLRLHPVAAHRQYGTVIAAEGGKPRSTVERSLFYILEVKTDKGLTGWGEISDIDPQELPQDAQEYGELLSAFFVGRSIWDVQRMHAEFQEHFETGEGLLPKYASCALEMAMYDLQGQASQLPVYELLGGAVRKDVIVSWVAYIREELSLIREEIKEKTSAGFRAFKLKVGVDIELDEARLATARETAGPEASIKVDANEGWSVAEAPGFIKRLNRFKLAGVETPVPRENPADIAAVRKQVGVPIMEHVSTLEYGLALLKADAVDAFNIATTGTGGIWPARQIVALAQSAGVGVLIGSTVELGLGTLAQLHLAATVPNLTLPSDLIGPGMYREDILTEPLRYQQGKLIVPQGIGLGGTVDREKLRELAFKN